MAYLHGNPGQGGTIMRHLALMLIVLAVIVGLTFDFSGDWLLELRATLVPLTIILVIMVYVSFKLQPRGWKKLFRRQAYLEDIAHDRAIVANLMQLDDRYFIIHDFTFELFHVEFLVVSPGGLFVIARIRQPGPLEMRDGILFAGGRTQETLTGNLWRICHLVHIVLQKGYDKDVMPQPLLVADEPGAVNRCDDIEIVTAAQLADLIGRQTQTVLDVETAEGFAYYVKQRYARKDTET